MGSAVILLLLLLAAFPIIAIVALVRASSLQRIASEIPQIIQRLHELEWRLTSLDQRVSALTETGSSERGREPAASAPSVASSALIPEPSRPGVPEPEAKTTSRGPTPTSIPATPRGPTAAAQAPPPLPPLQPPVSAPVPRQWEPNGKGDVESTIAGRWFNYVGILAIGLAVAFFLKYAFDNNWIGPAARVTIGFLVGGLMYPLSQWILKRGYTYYSEGIAGLGAGILYLSAWAGWHYYQIFSQGIAFPLMIMITVVTVGVAWMRNSQRIAILALVGGLLTPILVSTGENAEVTLFSYVAVLGAGMLAMAWERKWKWIAPIAFGGTLIYFWGWYVDFYDITELGLTLFFATLFFALYAALPALKSLREGNLQSVDIAIVASNAFSFLIALRLLLWPDYRWGLTLAVLGLAAAHWLMGRVVPRASSRVTRRLYNALAIIFATLAIPIRLEGKWITIAFALEGLLLIWSGLRGRSRALRGAGLALFAVVAIRLFILAVSAPAAQALLLNERFLTLAVCAACGLGAFFVARWSDCELSVAETQIYFVVAIAANFCFLLALSMDVWDWFGRMPSLGIDRERAQELALSVLWTTYALALIAAGVVRKSAAVRWQGLALLGLAIGKVFFFDLSFLTRFYRIISFFMLGLVLLAVSFFYQKRSKARAA
jgi:uncharacterized membrane protein